MRCVICGKESEFEQYCKECLLKTQPIIKDFKRKKVSICPKCNKIKYLNKWHYWKLEDFLIKYVNDNIVLNHNYKLKTIELLNYKCEKQKFIIEIKVNAIRDNKDISDYYEISISYEKELCNKCKKHTTQYFEAVMQLRNVDNEIIKFVKNNIKVKNVKIQKEKKYQKGMDLWITDMDVGKAIAKRLKKQFGGEVKISRKLYSRSHETSKNIYRLTILYKGK